MFFCEKAESGQLHRLYNKKYMKYALLPEVVRSGYVSVALCAAQTDCRKAH